MIAGERADLAEFGDLVRPAGLADVVAQVLAAADDLGPGPALRRSRFAAQHSWSERARAALAAVARHARRGGTIHT